MQKSEFFNQSQRCTSPVHQITEFRQTTARMSVVETPHDQRPRVKTGTRGWLHTRSSEHDSCIEFQC